MLIAQVLTLNGACSYIAFSGKSSLVLMDESGINF